MSKTEDNKAVVGRWFKDFWGEACNLSVVDAIAAPDMVLKYSLHEPRRGRADIKAFIDWVLWSSMSTRWQPDWPALISMSTSAATDPLNLPPLAARRQVPMAVT